MSGSSTESVVGSSILRYVDDSLEIQHLMKAGHLWHGAHREPSCCPVCQPTTLTFLTASRGCILFVAEIVGAIAATGLAKGLVPGNRILFAVSLAEGTTIAQGLFLEMMMTAELVFTIFMLAAEVRSWHAFRLEANRVRKPKPHLLHLSELVWRSLLPSWLEYFTRGEQ